MAVFVRGKGNRRCGRFGLFLPSTVREKAHTVTTELTSHRFSSPAPAVSLAPDRQTPPHSRDAEKPTCLRQRLTKVRERDRRETSDTAALLLHRHSKQ